MERYEFLYSDEMKFAPVQLERLNYGSAPLNGLQYVNEAAQGYSTWTIKFDSDQGAQINRGGFVALLMKADIGYSAYFDQSGFANGISNVDGDVQIIDVQVAQQGDEILTLSALDASGSYYVYIISEKYDNGYVNLKPSGIYVVEDERISEAKRFEIQTPSEFEFRVYLTKSVEEDNMNEWYNWQGSYTSPDLIWFDCDANISNIDIGNSIDFFEASDLAQIRFTPNDSSHDGQGVLNYFLNNVDGTAGGSGSELKVIRPSTPPTIIDTIPLYEIELPGNDNVRRLSINTPGSPTSDGTLVTETPGGIIGQVYSVDSHPIDSIPIHEEIHHTQGSGMTNAKCLYWPATGTESIAFYAYGLNQNPTPGAGGGSGAVQETAQLAIMQNIRFLKKMLTMVNENLWDVVTNTLAATIKSMNNVVAKINEFDDTNTIINRIETRIPTSSINVKLARLNEINTWEDYNLISTSNEVGLINIDLNIEQFTSPGKYLFSIKPDEFELYSPSYDEGILSFNNTETNREVFTSTNLNLNAMYGWNIEFFNADGSTLGITKMIVGSRANSDKIELLVSPLFTGDIDFSQPENLMVKIWQPIFESKIIQVDILEHNAQTLSYSLYGKRTMDRTNGLMKIYDHNGNVYKTFTMGVVSNGETSGDIIDYRYNIEDDDALMAMRKI